MSPRYELETVSPLHIGDGDQHTEMDSVITRSRFYSIDARLLHEKLYEKGELQNFLDHISREESIGGYLEDRKGMEPKDVEKYSLELTPQNRRDIKYLKNVSHFMKNANGEVYIPGSEIKGGIRTAILYSALLEEENYRELKEKLEKVKGKNLRGRKLGWELKNAWGNVEAGLLRGRRDDPKYDLLKYLEVSDSSTLLPEKLEIGHVMAYWSRGKHNYAEVLPPGIKVEGTMNIVSDKAPLEELGLMDKADRLSKDSIIEAVYTNTEDLIRHEIKFYRENGGRRASDFLKGMKKLREENGEDSPLLRLGRGQGFLSTTVSLLVKNRDPDLYDVIRKGARGRSYPDNFPKTRRFVVDEGGPKYRLGWVKLRLD